MIKPKYLIGGALLVALAWEFHSLWSAGFILWDDRTLILANPLVLEFSFGTILGDLSHGAFFPLTQLSLAVDHWLWGLNPRAMHFENFLWHSLNTGLVFFVGRDIFKLRPEPASFMDALFALHPLNVEPVAWISGGRKELLCTSFYLQALLLHHNAMAQPARKLGFVAAWLSGVFALCAKAMAVTLPALLIALSWRTRRGLWVGLSLLVVAGGALVLEVQAQRTGLQLSQEGFSWLLAGESFARSFLFALSRALYPRHLAVLYDPAVFAFDRLDFLILALASLFVGFWAWSAQSRSLPLFAGLAFCVALAPVAKLIPFGQQTVFNDRYFYLPGVFLSAALILILSTGRLRNWVWVGRAFGSACLMALAFQSEAQVHVWHSQETVWLNVEKLYPGSAKVDENLALYYLETGDFDKALGPALRATKRKPEDAEASSNLGTLLTRMGHNTDAEKEFLRGLAIHPNEVLLWNNLGYLYLARGDREHAEMSFQRALAIQPAFLNSALGWFDSAVGRKSKAEMEEFLRQMSLRFGNRLEWQERAARLSIEK